MLSNISKQVVVTGALAVAMVFGTSSAMATILVEDNFDSQNGGTGWAVGSDWSNTVSGGKLTFASGEQRQFAAPITESEYWMSITWEQTGSEQSFFTTGAWEGSSGQPYFLGFHETFQPGDSGQPRFPVEFLANAAPVGGFHTILMHVTNVVDDTSFDYELWAVSGDGSALDPNNLGSGNWMSGTRSTASTSPDRWNLSGGITVEFDRIAIATTAAEALIPEPASLALLGLGGLMMLRRRKA